MNKYTGISAKGYVLEVELHSDYSLVPDKVEIKGDMLSEYKLNIADLYNVSTGDAKKLVPTFFDKKKYLLHYENLQFYLRLGLKLKEIHLALEFSQSQCLKSYIEFNTKKNRSRKNNDKQRN